MSVRFSGWFPGSGRAIAAAMACCLLLFASAALAEGPSYVTIWMDPVAVHPAGQVLLRTFYRSNLSGGIPLHGSEIRFGWLVASAQGLWKEYDHFTMRDLESGAAGDISQQALFDSRMNEFEAPFDWASPPASVEHVLKTYTFTRAHAVNPRLGRGEVTWTQKGLYAKKKLLERNAAQMTLGQKTSLRGAGTEIEAAFLSRGVALFRNEGKPGPETRGSARGAKGAVFNLAGSETGGRSRAIRDAGVDVWEVDGIGLVTSPQKTQKKAQKKPQRSKARAR